MSGSEYGQLVPWDESAAHSLDIIGFPRGQLILETKSVLLAFLIEVVGALVEGLEARPAEIRTLGNMVVAHQPALSEPPKFDIDALIATGLAKAEETNDHVWLMRTDAAYLRRDLRTAAQAIPIHQNLVNGEQEAHLQILSEINRDSMEHALAFQLENSEKTPQDSFPTRFEFRDLYMFRYTAGKVEWRLKHGKRKDAFFDKYFFRHETLYWCIANLIEPPINRVRYPCELVFAFLDEYLANCDKEEKLAWTSDYTRNFRITLRITLLFSN
ncbi:uncharacterized protein PAC_15371 [Phialocephala subalpina]|uniref:Uncharacterized protein n=1 Tax=Phialocephala subalpina TaxID=576137 RepID=A0A1L7XK91_9HELO|nr:uncharacterized protein PAC_15371 [Phialocephala subalpina]